MKTAARVLIVFILLAALVPAKGAAAQTPPALNCQTAALMLGATAEEGTIDGAIYCILYPPDAVWNHDVVMFAHGYMNILEPISIPWETQLVIDETTTLPGLVLNLGYAFAVTSYSKNGLAVLQGLNDVAALAKHIRTTNDQVEQIYLTGASEGGLVTALAIEQYPQFFAGGLSTCGPIGSFQYQVQYWTDFRVAYDATYPTNSLAQQTTPIFVPQSLLPQWPLLIQEIGALLMADPQKAAGLLTATGVPFDPANPQTIGESVVGLLYYNVFATNDGRMTLVPGLTEAHLAPPSLLGNPYSNPAYITPAYPNGITADPAALAALKAYETTGKPKRALVVMHTTGDPIVPFNHSLMYVQKVSDSGKVGKIKKVTLIPISRYGHCAFEPVEMVVAFNAMVEGATALPFSSEQIQSALPNEKDQMKFQELMGAVKTLE